MGKGLGVCKMEMNLVTLRTLRVFDTYREIHTSHIGLKKGQSPQSDLKYSPRTKFPTEHILLLTMFCSGGNL